MAQWRQAAAKAWVVSKRMKLYDAALARRVLATQDGLEDFMKELEKLGALWSSTPCHAPIHLQAELTTIYRPMGNTAQTQ